MQLPSGGNQQVPVAQSQTPVSGHSRSESQSSTVSANKQVNADTSKPETIVKPDANHKLETSKSIEVVETEGDAPPNVTETSQPGATTTTETTTVELETQVITDAVTTS